MGLLPVKLRFVHATGMPGTFSPSLGVSDPDMHHGTCVTHLPWYMPASLTSGFLWNRWRRKRSRHSRRMRNPHFYVSGKKMSIDPSTDISNEHHMEVYHTSPIYPRCCLWCLCLLPWKMSSNRQIHLLSLAVPTKWDAKIAFNDYFLTWLLNGCQLGYGLRFFQTWPFDWVLLACVSHATDYLTTNGHTLSIYSMELL